jgi:hypothetical protein
MRPVKYMVELVSCHVVVDAHVSDDILDEEGPCYEQKAFLAVLSQVRSDRTVVHKQQIGSEQLLIENRIHFVTFDSFQIATSVCQQSKRYSSRPKSHDSISGSLNRIFPSEKHSVDIADDDRSEGALLLSYFSGISDNSMHEIILIEE